MTMRCDGGETGLFSSKREEGDRGREAGSARGPFDRLRGKPGGLLKSRGIDDGRRPFE